MPNVGSNEFKGYSSSWQSPTNVQGHNGSAWKYGIAVYIHNGTSWVEVWNARPEVTSTSMATTSTGLTFSGTADPNNFSTTAKFEYKEVGGSYSDSGTTSTGMGDGVDGAVSYTVTATVANTYKNWEARASATNTAGTGTGSNVTLDCRKHDAGGSGWGTSVDSGRTDVCDQGPCDGCGTSSYSRTTYTKSGCQSYYVDTSCSSCGWTNVTDSIGSSGTFGGYAFTYATYGFFGETGIYWSPSSQCDPRGIESCCGGYQIKYFQAQRCLATGAERWVNPVCFSVF
jgi:hypothetical protein